MYCGCVFVKLVATIKKENENSFTPGGGVGGVLPYLGYLGMCCEGYGFQAVYSRIGNINQNIWV